MSRQDSRSTGGCECHHNRGVCTITEPDPDGLMESDSDDDYDYMECDDPLASSMDAPQSTSVLMEHDCDMALDGGISRHLRMFPSVC